MARLTPLHLLPALIAAASHAGEVTIEKRPFTIEQSFSATALPAGETAVLRLDPKAWSGFEIASIAAHGSQVKKGDLLAGFDATDIDRKLADARRETEAGALSLAQAELDFKTLQETAPNKLESIRRAATVAKEENDYFVKIRRKASEGRAEQELKRSGQILENQREELRQLDKMYKADDITEETEEIILTRQKDAVAAAEFALSMETLDHKRTLEVTLPREAKILADAERDTAIAQKKAEADVPRGVELAKLDLAGKATSLQRARQQLAELESDRALFELKASADGWFYHGPIENGRWSPAEISKALVPHGQIPPHKPFATFVPATAKMMLVAFIDEATARGLPTDLTGIATFSGREDLESPVKLLKVASSPGVDGTYRADFSLTWPEGIPSAAGSTARIHLVSYQQPAAIVIPTKALDYQSNGWTVEVRLADGKTERRVVKRGRSNKDETELLSGIEVGQVILVP